MPLRRPTIWSKRHCDICIQIYVNQTKRSRVQGKPNWHRFHALPAWGMYPFKQVDLRVFLTGEILLAENFPNTEMYSCWHTDSSPTNFRFPTDGKHKYPKRYSRWTCLTPSWKSSTACKGAIMQRVDHPNSSPNASTQRRWRSYQPVLLLVSHRCATYSQGEGCCSGMACAPLWSIWKRLLG